MFAFSRALVASFLVFGLVLTSSCTKRVSGPVTDTEIWIGEYGSMTGSEATFGVATHRGIVLAFDAVNQKGGIKGKKLKLVSYDDQGKSDEAVTAITKLLTQDKVLMVLGEVASSRSIAAGAVAQQYQIPMISPSSTNPAVTKIGDFIFRVCFIDPFQGEVMAKFARESLKVSTAAILRDIRSDYSMGLSDYFKKAFENKGGKVNLDTAYSSGDVDFKSQITQVLSSKPEALFVPGYYTEVGLIARQARELGYKGVLLGGDGWDSEKLTEIGGNHVEGSYFSNHYSHEDKSPRVQKFVSDYRDKFGEIPNGLAAMGYDAALVAIEALEKASALTPKAVRDAIAQFRTSKP